MPALLHVTVLTGHVRTSPRSEVADHVISGLQTIIAKGGGVVGNTGWEVLIVERSPDGAIFDLSHRGIEVARCFLAVTSTSERRRGSKPAATRVCLACGLPSRLRHPSSQWGSCPMAWR